MKFWAITKHLTINQKQTHELEMIHNNMIIMKGKDKYHKLITPNMATQVFHDNTRAVLNNPFEIDSQYKIENLPFSLKGAFDHFLETITITALANITIKMDCKTGTEGNLKTITSKQDLNKGQTLTPEHTCAIQITTNGMTIARRTALKQKHRLKQIFPEHDRDNITAHYMQIKFENQTKAMITKLEKDIKEEETDNSMIHISYNAIFGTVTLILLTLIMLKWRNKNKKKKANKNRKETNTTKIIINSNRDSTKKATESIEYEAIDEETTSYTEQEREQNTANQNSMETTLKTPSTKAKPVVVNRSRIVKAVRRARTRKQLHHEPKNQDVSSELPSLTVKTADQNRDAAED
jgi:hypothetical protein